MRAGHVYQYAHDPARVLFHVDLYDRNDILSVLGQKPKQLGVYADRLHALRRISHGLRRWPWNPHGCWSCARVAYLGRPLLDDCFRIIFSSFPLLQTQIFFVPREHYYDDDASDDVLSAYWLAIFIRQYVWHRIFDVWPLYCMPLDHFWYLNYCRAVRTRISQHRWPCALTFRWPIWLVHQDTAHLNRAEWERRKEEEKKVSINKLNQN